jgi:hypothetical protein
LTAECLAARESFEEAELVDLTVVIVAWSSTLPLAIESASGRGSVIAIRLEDAMRTQEVTCCSFEDIAIDEPNALRRTYAKFALYSDECRSHAGIDSAAHPRRG